MAQKSFIYLLVKILSFTTILKLLASLIVPDSIFKTYTGKDKTAYREMSTKSQKYIHLKAEHAHFLSITNPIHHCPCLLSS